GVNKLVNGTKTGVSEGALVYVGGQDGRNEWRHTKRWGVCACNFFFFFLQKIRSALVGRPQIVFQTIRSALIGWPQLVLQTVRVALIGAVTICGFAMGNFKTTRNTTRGFYQIEQT